MGESDESFPERLGVPDCDRDAMAPEAREDEASVNFGLKPRPVGIAVDPPVVAGENAGVPVLPKQDQRISERLEPFPDPGFERLSGLAVMVIDKRYR